MSAMISEIAALIRKEFRLEFRNRSAISSMLLYILSTIFICYQSFKVVSDPPVWNALLWIIILFASINAVTKSFYSETRGQQYYYYQLARPEAIIFAKIGYNIVLVTALNLLSYIFYSLVIGSLVEQHLQFIVVLLLGSIGISSILTLISAIASKTNNNVGLISILGFPVMIPLLITVIKASKNVTDQVSMSVNIKYLATLSALDILVILLAFILFPYLWRD